jgi:hypothetical protein
MSTMIRNISVFFNFLLNLITSIIIRHEFGLSRPSSAPSNSLFKSEITYENKKIMPQSFDSPQGINIVGSL